MNDLAEQIERYVQEIGEMEAAIERDGLTVPGSKGQPRAHPLLAELRAHRAELRRLRAEQEADRYLSEVNKLAGGGR